MRLLLFAFYADMGSSRDIAIGPVAVVSLLLRAMLQNEIEPADDFEASAKLEFINQQNLIMNMENKALKQRLESLAQEQLSSINSRTRKSGIELASGKHLPSSQSLIPILKRNNSVTHIFTGN
ncbi:sulfate transporter 1 [Striga asiatica]|uniref:Sulfate transporter 1 n=1 Tax=Striga asiatica TaxID=4170 RepID=A0A5A7QEI4_STRAF|nr:sulfate transporter 1 [Striga asiatica]